jgi:glycerate-2-kinase
MLITIYSVLTVTFDEDNAYKNPATIKALVRYGEFSKLLRACKRLIENGDQDVVITPEDEVLQKNGTIVFNGQHPFKLATEFALSEDLSSLLNDITCDDAVSIKWENMDKVPDMSDTLDFRM